MAAATLLVKPDWCSDFPTEELEAVRTLLVASFREFVVDETSVMEAWIRSPKRLKLTANWPNSSLDRIDKRRVRSPSPWAISSIA
ncbi:hypothetical protein D3C78_1276850 [compost metagenome]